MASVENSARELLNTMKEHELKYHNGLIIVDCLVCNYIAALEDELTRAPEVIVENVA